MQKQLSERFFKKSVMSNFAEFTRKHLRRNLLFYRVKLSRSATVDLFIKCESLAQVFSCEFCKICKNTVFAEHYRRLLLIAAVSIVVKGELANETVNYDTKTKVYVPIWARTVSYQKRQSWWNLNRFQKQSFADFLKNRCS